MNECYHGILLDFIQCQCDTCKELEEEYVIHEMIILASEETLERIYREEEE